MMMWYDVLVLGILAFFAMRGAMRGFIFQIASLAGIVLCFLFADAVSTALSPYVHLDPPLNQWVVMVGAYLGFTLLCFLAARMLNEILEKCKLKEFDRHLGVVFGLLKGVLLVMIMTFFVVTVSEKARASLKNSYTGRYCAIIMDRLEPILPHRLHVALEDYIHLLDSPDLPLHNRHDPFDTDHNHSSDSGLSLGTPSTLPTFPVSNSNPGSTGNGLWSQLESLFDSKSKQVISNALQNTDPQTRSQIEQKLNSLVSSIPPEDRARLQEQIVDIGSSQLQQYLDWKLRELETPAGTKTPVVAPIPGSPVSNPNPAPSSPPIPSSGGSNQHALIQEIARVYSPLDNVQQNIHQDIQRRISGVPESISNAVLMDWRSDLYGIRPDPVPETGPDVTIEVRILRQLEIQKVRMDQLSPEAQQRLRASQAQTSSTGNL